MAARRVGRSGAPKRINLGRASASGMPQSQARARKDFKAESASIASFDPSPRQRVARPTAVKKPGGMPGSASASRRFRRDRNGRFA